MKTIIKKIKILIRYALICINDILIHFPVRKKVALFESFNGKGLTDNPKAIYDAIIHMDPHAYSKLYWGVKAQYFPKIRADYPNINIVKRWSFKWIFISATANFWFFNSRMPTWWKKNKNTIYVQTWHGTPLKKLGFDMDDFKIPGMTRNQYLSEFKKESNRWDYLVAGNQFSENVFRHAFQFDHKFLSTGYPRNDILIKQNTNIYIRALKKRIIGNDKLKVITYAPTWRDDKQLSFGKYAFDMPFNIDNFLKVIPENVILLIRPHYLVQLNLDIKKYNGRVKIDDSTDMKDLYLISDLLITDYSSVMFDYAVLKRPMIFYAYDEKHYENGLRGFYFDYWHELPGPIANNEAELLSDVKDVINNNFKVTDIVAFKKFQDKFLQWEQGNASSQIAEKIYFRGDLKK